MTTRNSVTGDKIKSRPPTDKYRENYDRIFRKKKKPTKEPHAK